MTPYYEDEAVRLYLGDWREFEGLRGDAVIADPPYGETALAWDRWPDGWPGAAVGIASQMWCFGSFRMFWNRRDEFGGWRLAQEIVWEKHNGSGFAADRFKRVHELAAHFYVGQWSELYRSVPRVPRTGPKKAVCKRGATPHTGVIGVGDGYEDDGSRMMRSVLQVQSCQGRAENETQKPEGIVRPLVEYSCPSGGTVVSLFAGSGTDLLVAKATGRRAIGFEIREQQCEVAARRLSQNVLDLGAA